MRSEKTNIVAVIGSGSSIGQSLAWKLGSRALCFARHPKNNQTINFDLEDLDSFKKIKIRFNRAIVCVGNSNIAYCEENEKETYKINCYLIYKLIEYINEMEIPVTVLSSSAVFGHYSRAPGEEKSEYSPTCIYASQKAFIDDYVMKLSGSNQVIRLTKVIAMTGIFQEIYIKLHTGGSLSLYEDLMFSPISLEYTTQSIVDILDSGLPGVFHLSGDQMYSYYQFAERLIITHKIKVNPELKIIPKITPHSIYVPINAALGMQRTIRDLNIYPQSFISVARDFMAGQKSLYPRFSPA